MVFLAVAYLICFTVVVGIEIYYMRHLYWDNPLPIPEVIYRLPSNIKPIHYEIHLTPYLRESDARPFTFDGECKIEIQALQTTKQIQLHISNLNMTLTIYYKKDSKVSYILPDATPNSLTDIVVYNLNEELQANVSYILHYKYVGSINERMMGFYRSKYTTEFGIKWFGATQFQPFHARSAFPCFDEPNYKATFNLSLTCEWPFQSTGPTVLVKKIISDFHTKFCYNITPTMSTNLMTFTVFDFYFKSDNKLGVFATPEFSNQTKYSRYCGRRLFDAFRNYFNTSSRILFETDIDFYIVPTSELSKSLLLYDENGSSLKSKELVTNTVAFEVARLWWGKTVTCKWWGYIWLNDGFATYFQYFGTDLVDSSFDMSSQFVVDVIQNVMNQDATYDTSPMTNENVRTKDDIIRMFNRISYQKAAAFIRMTKDILGEENFRRSLIEYLTTYAYKNTSPTDLFNIWNIYWPLEHQQFSQKYFESFTIKVGYPVITFKRTSDITVEVSQKRFLLKDFKTADPNLIYTVPITFTTSSDKNFQNVTPTYFLESNTLTFSVSSEVSWIIGNIQETGFYRVNYDENSWNEISQKLFSDSMEEIHVLNRAQIVDDLLNLARAGEIDYILALNILKYLENENDYLPWYAALKGFSFLMTRLGTESNFFVPFLRGIILQNLDGQNFERNINYKTLGLYRRTYILDFYCRYITKLCIKEAKHYFDTMSNIDYLDVNMRSVVYCTVMREGNETNFDRLFTKYKAETVASEKRLILDSLSCVKDSKLVARFFQIIISNDFYAADRAIALCNLCIKNIETVDYVFNLIDEHIEQLANAIGGYHYVASIVLEIAEHFTTESHKQKLKDFNERHIGKFASSSSTLQRAVNIVEENLEWSRKYLIKIKSYSEP